MAQFFDTELAGNELYSVIQTLGEDVYFHDSDGGKIFAKQCLDTAIRKSQATSEKMFQFKGEMTFDNDEFQSSLLGEYFYNDKTPDKTYMLVSTIGNPHNLLLANVEVVECNEVIDIGHETKITNPVTGNDEVSFVKKYSDVQVFSSTSMVTPSNTQVGVMQRSKTMMYLPSFCLVSAKDFVLRQEVKEDGDGTNFWGNQLFDIQDIDTSMIKLVNEKRNGITKIDVVKHI